MRFSHIPGAVGEQDTERGTGRSGWLLHASPLLSGLLMGSAISLDSCRCPVSGTWDRFLQTPCSHGSALITQLLTAAEKCKGGAEHSYRYRQTGDILGHNKLSREFLIWVQTVYANYMAAVLAISIHAFNLNF